MFRSSLVAAALAVSSALLVAPVAQSAPSSVTSYPKGASATRFTGQAFDTCTAPPLSSMQAWRASPYGAMAVYSGGDNRSCAQPELTRSWVSSVTAMGWRLIPVHLGRQAPCSTRDATKITPSRAAEQGAADATEAIAAVKALGMMAGSAIYFDLEHYDATDDDCRTAVLRFLSGWTTALHAKGYLSGVYANLNSGAAQLSAAYFSTAYARPDALWVARWDADPTLTGLKGVPDTHWGTRQRAKQYLGDHLETHAGIRLNVDSNTFDAPVATVPRDHTSVGGTTNARTGPSSRTTAVRAVRTGTPLRVLCQTTGRSLKGTTVWDKLSDGTYVSDHFVDTSGSTGFTAGIPRCYLPYQVTVADSLTRRSAPRASAKAVGTIRAGGLAWVSCQAPGSTSGRTKVWDRVAGGSYVTDRYVATASATGYTSALPRCV